MKSKIYEVLSQKTSLHGKGDVFTVSKFLLNPIYSDNILINLSFLLFAYWMPPGLTLSILLFFNIISLIMQFTKDLCDSMISFKVGNSIYFSVIIFIIISFTTIPTSLLVLTAFILT